MRVLFTSLRNSSHFLPLVPFIDACRRSGHEVAVASPSDFAERAAATGAAFFPFGHPGEERLRPLWMRLREVSGEETMRIATGEIFAGACAGAAIPALLETLERWRPSIVVRETQEYAAVVAAEKLGIPHIRVAIHAPSAENQIFGYAAPSVDGHGRAAELSPDPDGERLLRETSLTLFPASLEAQGIPLATVSRFRASPPKAPPLPDWWGALAGPLVYATLGTVVGGFDILRAAYRPVLDALADMPVRALLTIGADLPLEALGEVPPNVHIERFVPQGDVIPHAAAVICHGGSGTVLGAIAGGVPLVVAPMFADQPFNAARVAAAGAGIALPTSQATAATLRQALGRVLEEPSFRLAARRLGQEIALLPSVDEAPAVIERLGGVSVP
jgi:UDP:flavonoid glycosyltransferase YjiC (YdhE family)